MTSLAWVKSGTCVIRSELISVNYYNILFVNYTLRICHFITNILKNKRKVLCSVRVTLDLRGMRACLCVSVLERKRLHMHTCTSK